MNKKIVTFTNSVQHYTEKGNRYFIEGDFAKATHYLRKVYAIDKSQTEVKKRLAVSLSQVGLHEESNEILYQLVKSEAEGLDCHFYLGRNLFGLSDFNGAAEELVFFVERYQVDDDLLLEAEEILEFLESDAIDDTLLDYDESALHQLELGTRLMNEESYQDAIEVFRKSIEKSPGFWPAYNNLAVCYLYTEQEDLAVEVLQQIITADETNLHALCNVYSIYLKNGNELKAFQILEKLKKIRPVNVEQADRLAVTFAVTGEYKAAYKWFKYYESYDQLSDYNYHFWFAKSAFHAGHEEEANRIFKFIGKKFREYAETPPWELNFPMRDKS